MLTLRCVLLALGLIVGLYGEVRFLVVTYNRNLWWLVRAAGGWIFFLLNPKAIIKPFGLQVLGLLMAGLGCWLSKVVWPA